MFEQNNKTNKQTIQSDHKSMTLANKEDEQVVEESLKNASKTNSSMTKGVIVSKLIDSSKEEDELHPVLSTSDSATDSYDNTADDSDYDPDERKIKTKLNRIKKLKRLACSRK